MRSHLHLLRLFAVTGAAGALVIVTAFRALAGVEHWDGDLEVHEDAGDALVDQAGGTSASDVAA